MMLDVFVTQNPEYLLAVEILKNRKCPKFRLTVEDCVYVWSVGFVGEGDESRLLERVPMDISYCVINHVAIG